MLVSVAQGHDLREVILSDGGTWITRNGVQEWLKMPDSVVIEKYLGAACPIQNSFPVSLYLAWKYASDFAAGVCANAQGGGDSCNRGAVVGSLLGLANGVPVEWVRGLVSIQNLKLPEVA